MYEKMFIFWKLNKCKLMQNTANKLSCKTERERERGKEKKNNGQYCHVVGGTESHLHYIWSFLSWVLTILL